MKITKGLWNNYKRFVNHSEQADVLKKNFSEEKQFLSAVFEMYLVDSLSKRSDITILEVDGGVRNKSKPDLRLAFANQEIVIEAICPQKANANAPLPDGCAREIFLSQIDSVICRLTGSIHEKNKKSPQIVALCAYDLKGCTFMGPSQFPYRGDLHPRHALIQGLYGTGVMEFKLYDNGEAADFRYISREPIYKESSEIKIEPLFKNPKYSRVAAVLYFPELPFPFSGRKTLDTDWLSWEFCYLCVNPLASVSTPTDFIQGRKVEWNDHVYELDNRVFPSKLFQN